MLKITRSASSNDETTLYLDGRVTGQWIQLLHEHAESILSEGLRLSLDLKNIYFIDCEGLSLIKNLISRGVQQLNAPLFVAEQLRKCEGAQEE
jgi:ABC-type transporter Mla MlaB component